MLSSFAYDHDDCGNRTQMTEATGDVTTYAYDSIYELTGQTKRNSGNVVQYSYSYTYDDIGNRLTLTDQGSAVTTSTYNAGGQLTGTDASGTLTTYTYDASGNLAAEVTSAGTRSYTWDYDDRLTDIEYPDSSETNYTYNSAGQRLTRVEGGATTKFVYDGAKVVLERDGDDETAGALHPRGRLALQRPAEPTARWSKRRLPARWAREREADSRQLRGRREQLQLRGLRTTNGRPERRLQPLPVRRRLRRPVGELPEPLLYAGQILRPGRRRFISEDPYGGSPQDPLSLHRYLYCANGPANYTDAGGMLSDWLQPLADPEFWYWVVVDVIVVVFLVV